MKIGKTLKTIRLVNNRTVKEIAEIINMSENNYSKIERNEIDISLANAKKIATFYQITIDQIINDSLSLSDIQVEKSFEGLNVDFNEPKNKENVFFDSIITNYKKQIDLFSKQLDISMAQIEFLNNELCKKNTIIHLLLKEK